MAQIQAKMADKSTFVVDAAEFNNFELPNKPWFVTFYKLNSWRCYAIGLDTYSGVISSAAVLKYAVYNYSEWLGWFSLVKNSDLTTQDITNKNLDDYYTKNMTWAYAVGCTNRPSNNQNGYFRVTARLNQCLQEYLEYSTNKYCVRQRLDNGSWTQWTEK